MEPIIYAFVSIKGGSAKTGSVILLASHLNGLGKKALVIDLDHQGSSTTHFGIDSNTFVFEQKNSAQMLMNAKIEPYITKSYLDHIDFIAADTSLVDLRAISYKKLAQIIKGVNNYDYIIIDAPGTYDNHVESAIYCANYIITPITFSSFCYKDALYLEKFIDQFNQGHHWHLMYSLYSSRIPTKGDSLSRQWVEAFDEHFTHKILKNGIPKSAKISELIDAHKALPKPQFDHTHNISAKIFLTMNEIIELSYG